MVLDFQATFLDYLPTFPVSYQTYVFSSTIYPLLMAIVQKFEVIFLAYETSCPYFHKMVPDNQVIHPCCLATYLHVYPTCVFS
jgi:hypothetical protein